FHRVTPDARLEDLVHAPVKRHYGDAERTGFARVAKELARLATPRSGHARFGGIMSVIEPSAISAPKNTVSESVGWGWIVRPMSSASAPLSSAHTVSAT